MELVVGKREEFYWEKVPEKIRRQAVEKAISLMHPSTMVNVANEDAGESSDKKRKRRKH
jgi:ribosomal protein L4